MSEKLLENEFV